MDSKISNRSQNPNPAQTADIEKATTSHSKLPQDTATGDKAAVKADRKEVKADLKQAHKDGVDDKTLNRLDQNFQRQDTGALLSAHLKSGGTPIDHKSEAILRGGFQRYCFTHGLSASKKNIEQFSKDAATGMKETGMSSADIQSALHKSFEAPSTLARLFNLKA